MKTVRGLAVISVVAVLLCSQTIVVAAEIVIENDSSWTVTFESSKGDQAERGRIEPEGVITLRPGESRVLSGLPERDLWAFGITATHTSGRKVGYSMDMRWRSVNLFDGLFEQWYREREVGRSLDCRRCVYAENGTHEWTLEIAIVDSKDFKFEAIRGGTATLQPGETYLFNLDLLGWPWKGWTVDMTLRKGEKTISIRSSGNRTYYVFKSDEILERGYFHPFHRAANQ